MELKELLSRKEESAKYFSKLNMNYLRFQPSDLMTKQQKPEEMNLSELKRHDQIQEKARAGSDQYFNRILFKIFISNGKFGSCSFRVPISANKRRGGLAVQVGINILVTFIYLVFMQISMAFGKNGVLNPMLTAWFADLVFLAGAFVNLPRIRQ